MTHMIREFTRGYLSDLKQACDTFPLDSFEAVAQALISAYEGGKQVFVMGNGGSAVTASHFACDLNKGVSYGLEKRFKLLCLSDNVATVLAYANDVSYDDIYVEQLKNFLAGGDVVIAISGSGNSANVIKAVEYANANGAVTIGFTGFQGGRLNRLVQVPLLISIQDMQKVEDVHMIITHMLTSYLYRALRAQG